MFISIVYLNIVPNKGLTIIQFETLFNFIKGCTISYLQITCPHSLKFLLFKFFAAIIHPLCKILIFNMH